GRITRNALIAYALCGGRWSEYSERYIAGNYSVEMGRLAGGTLYCNPVNYASNEAQKEKFLTPVAKDGQIGASAMTEFNAGSDIFNMELSLLEKDDKIITKGRAEDSFRKTMAEIAVKNRGYARMNPYAHGPMKITVEDVINSPVIAYPLRALDCCLMSVGSACGVVCDEKTAYEITDNPLRIWIGAGSHTLRELIGVIWKYHFYQTKSQDNTII
ncbi:unnamed protein product, partial [marine sediment metagenome]